MPSLKRRQRAEFIAHEALARIAEIAASAAQELIRKPGSTMGPEPAGEEPGDDESSPSAAMARELPSCSIRPLPQRLQVQAAMHAIKVYMYNAHVPIQTAKGADVGPEIVEPQRLTVLTTKYWGPFPRRLTVSFLESTPPDLRKKIVAHCNAWAESGGISFVETVGIGEVRISRGRGGYWSYVGTDIHLIPKDRPTMNLEGFSLNTPESEYRRVVRHEAGHTLGFPHEHMRRELVNRIDPERAFNHFWQTQRWDRAMVQSQVLTPLEDSSVMGTPADETSIMAYQLPGVIMRDGRPVVGGEDINASDHAFNRLIYPRGPGGWAGAGAGEAGPEIAASTVDEFDWPDDQDVEIPE